MPNEKEVEELLPCPFCGNEPRLKVHEADTKPFMYFTDRYCVLCDYNDGGCGTEGPHRKDKYDAIELWNTRPTPAQDKGLDINTEELKKEWEENFYESGWNVQTLDLTKTEKAIIEELTRFLPRHMPEYDWNLPYAEEFILIMRRHLSKFVRPTVNVPSVDEIENLLKN